MSAPQTSVQSTHPFTCNTCQVAFRSSELQRAHMQTDWHRYNLKRRVASLPPLSSEIFAEKVLANKASAAATAAKASFEKACQACQKTFYSENSYNNHLKSQKHKTNVAKAQRQGPIDDTASVMSSTFSLGDPVGAPPSLDGDAEQEFSKVVDGIKQTSLDDKEEPISRRPTRPHHSSAENRAEHPLSQSTTSSSASAADDRESVTSSTKPKIDPLLACLFCNYLSPSFQLNLHHMSRFHSMFLPEQDYLVDPEGLIKYLRSKIDDQHRCLYCNKAKHTASGIQTHMKDRGHSMIAFESENEALEVGDFYDFSSTWDDVEHFKAMQEEIEDVTDDSESTAGGGVKLSAPRKFTRSTNGIDEEEDDGWETDSTLSSVPTDEITSVPIDDRSHRYKLLSKSRHHTHGDPRPHRNADGFHSHAHTTPVAVYHDDYELHLPSGRTAGHRSLNRYFRQNLRNYPGVAERMESRRAITAGSSDSEGDVDMDRDHRQRGRQLITRANGGVGMIGVSDAKKAEVRKIEKKSRRDEQIARSRYQAGNEKRANQQKHFRDPLLQ